MTLGSTSEPLGSRYSDLLLDLDGVVYRGPSAVDHAVEALDDARTAGLSLTFVTNNAARTPTAVADHLNELGITAVADEVVTSSHAVAAKLCSLVDDGKLDAHATVLVVGREGLRTAVEDAGFRRVESAGDRPAVVVQGFGPDTSWRDLAEAAYAIGAGATWIASNVDATLPTERGLAPGNGSLVAALALTTGQRPISVGKPDRQLFDTALEGRQVDAEAALVIGDRLDSDIEGAVNAGLDSLLVLTGVSGLAELFAAVPARRPTFVGFDLRALREPQATVASRVASRVASTVSDRVEAGDTGRTCGGWTVCPDGGGWTVDGDGSPTALLRAATEAAWDRPDLDRGGLAEAVARLRA